MSRIRNWLVFGFLTFCLLTPLAMPQQPQPDANVDKEAARKVADAFINDIISEHTEAAANLYLKAPLTVLGPATIESRFIRPVLQRCGQPLGPLQNTGDPIIEEIGLSDGSRHTRLTFQYFSRTTQETTYRFDVQVTPDQGIFEVNGFSCRPLTHNRKRPPE